MGEYKKLSVRIEGKTIKDIIVAIDCVAASLERDQFSGKSEAPDKSGRYNFKVFKEDSMFAFDSIDFDKMLDEANNEIYLLKNEIEILKENLSKVDNKNTLLEKENTLLKKDVEKKAVLLEKEEKPKIIRPRVMTY